MRFRLFSVSASALLLGLLTARTLSADVRLPAVLANHMVLQRNVPVRIWGWADPGESIDVSLDAHSQQATANTDGTWSVELPALSADGATHTIIVTGNNTVTLTDVLAGDVWIGSGQSNMEWQVRMTHAADEAIAAANHLQLRLFHVPKTKADAPGDDVEAEWRVCTPDSIPRFSAVLYYYGLRLQQELNVPIGLINTSWGGTAIEPWTTTGDHSGELYNAMVAPLTNLSVRGVIWYQGETNILLKNGFSYADKMKDLIIGWRLAFRNQQLPFYYVQIAPWSGRYEEGELPAVWEAQTATLNIPHTGMVVTTDLVDDISDIHPRNKRDVGNRLALWGLSKTYGRDDIVFSGPIYKSMQVNGNEIRLEFHYTADGLKSGDGQDLTEFRIAGSDGRFVDAGARIDGHAVVVSSPEGVSPSQVEFGWNKLASPNLTNSAGLPASPFRTKDWRGAIIIRD